jgi:peptide/nickel transport system substrate-binding protein
MKVALAQVPPDLNAFQTPSSPRSFFIRGLYSTLTQTASTKNSAGNVQTTDQPYIASKWTQTNPTTWDFTIKPNLTFPNGEALDASSVVFTLQYVLDAANKAALAARFGGVKSYSAPDPLTFEIVTKAVDPLVPREMAELPIVAPKAFAAAGETAYWTKPIGTGPWVLGSYTPSQSVVLKRNTDSIGTTSKLEEVDFTQISDDAARNAALQSGQVDAINLVSPDTSGSLTSAGLDVVAGVDPSVTLIDLFAKTGPLNNPQVRQAINYAIDKDSIVKNLYKGLGGIAQGQLTPSNLSGSCSTVTAYPYDVAKAKSLLAAAGIKAGQLTLTFQTSQGFFLNDSTMAQAVQQMLQQVGINVRLDVMEYANYLNVYYGTAPKDNLFQWRPSVAPLLDNSAQAVRFTTAYTTHNTGYSNPQYDALVAKAATEALGSSERQADYCQAATILKTDAPVIFMINPPDVWATSTKVHGFIDPVDVNPPFEQMTVTG